MKSSCMNGEKFSSHTTRIEDKESFCNCVIETVVLKYPTPDDLVNESDEVKRDGKKFDMLTESEIESCLPSSKE